jgi:hypothetical protein
MLSYLCDLFSQKSISISLAKKVKLVDAKNFKKSQAEIKPELSAALASVAHTQQQLVCTHGSPLQQLQFVHESGQWQPA